MISVETSPSVTSLYIKRASLDRPLVQKSTEPVFAADDVAIYTKSLPEGTDVADVVASMAPPFIRFFIEFQRVPNAYTLHAWRVYITVEDDPKNMPPYDGGGDSPRWLLKMDTFIERYKLGFRAIAATQYQLALHRINGPSVPRARDR